MVNDVQTSHTERERERDRENSKPRGIEMHQYSERLSLKGLLSASFAIPSVIHDEVSKTFTF